jgi:hypothetical protein
MAILANHEPVLNRLPQSPQRTQRGFYGLPDLSKMIGIRQNKPPLCVLCGLCGSNLLNVK